MFDNEAKADCCGAHYQLTDYYISNPTKSESKLLKLLASGKYAMLSCDEKLIPAIKRLMKETKSKDIENITDSLKNTKEYKEYLNLNYKQ